MAVPVVAVGSVERGQVELVDHVTDEPGQVAFGEPVAQVRGEQEGLVALCAQEGVGHSRSYLLAALIPNVLILTSLLHKADDSADTPSVPFPRRSRSAWQAIHDAGRWRCSE